MPKAATEKRVLLTDKELAFYLGLSRDSLRSARSNKPNLRMPPFVRIGWRVRYDLDDVLDWMCAQAIKRVGAR